MFFGEVADLDHVGGVSGRWGESRKKLRAPVSKATAGGGKNQGAGGERCGAGGEEIFGRGLRKRVSVARKPRR